MAGRKVAQKPESEPLKATSDVIKQKVVPFAEQQAGSATRRSRGPVDAPGKRHRKPLPPERLDKRMGEPRGKQMGQKASKTRGRGRG